MAIDLLDPISLSALQHWAYCPRQFALIHLEQVFEENIHTERGQALHKRVDDPGFEVRSGLRVERALPLFNDELGLIGKADVVEFSSDGTPYPVEYKNGSRDKRTDIAACDDVQLTAQALCLEAMFARPVLEGALYYASSKRRRTVAFSDDLRAQTLAIIREVRAALIAGKTPPPRADERCRACSLADACQPHAIKVTQDSNLALSHLFDPEV